MKDIRVGIIRCDLHAMMFSALFDKHYSPVSLRDDSPRGHAAYYYLYTYYSAPERLMFPKVPGLKIVKVWDEDRKAAESMAGIFGKEVAVCSNYDEVSDGVDLVFIADCNGDGSDKLQLAAPGLKKGVPTFVDKPLAYEYAQAKKITELAEENDTPVLSLSILRELPHAGRFRQRLPELGEVDFGTIKGGGTKMSGHIHAISLAQHIFGSGVESVECMGDSPLGFVHLNYGDKKDRPEKGVMLNCDTGRTYHASFYASAFGTNGAIHSPDMGDFEFPWGMIKILEKIKEMVLSGKCPVSIDDMLENIAVATAGRLAWHEHRKVYLEEIT